MANLLYGQFAAWPNLLLCGPICCVVTFLHLNVEDWVTTTIFYVANLLHDPICCMYFVIF